MGHAFEHTVHSTLTQGVMGASLRSYTGVFSKWLHNVLVPERLRGLTRNQLGSACAGSSPAEHDVLSGRKPKEREACPQLVAALNAAKSRLFDALQALSTSIDQR